MIDSPHGQEKTHTQKEIREETGSPQKENNPEEKARPGKERHQKEARTRQEARAPHARRRFQSDFLAPGSSRLRKRGRIDGRRSGIRGRSDQRRGKRPRPRPG